MKQLYCLTVLVCVMLIFGSSFARATDETEAFEILIQSLTEVEKQPEVCSAIMRGMLSGMEGRRNVPAPLGWSILSERFAKSENADVRELSQRLSQIFGDMQATQQALALVKDVSADEGQRRSALQSLLEQQNVEASQLLESLLDEPALAVDAIRGYAVMGNESAPKILLDRYPKLAPALRRAAVETLATRKNYAEALLSAIVKKEVSREEIPVHVARSLAEILGESFTKVYGDIRPVAEDRERLLAKYKAMITPEAIADADASRGRVIFKKTCAACHLLYGDGGLVGPELTGSNRANLDYILLNSVDPSYDVPDAYKMVQILTTDGRAINGVLAEEDAVRIVLKTAEQPRVVIAKEDIETRKISPKSMMPDGQLDQLNPSEVIDLIKYLRTTEQVELPK
jgi:putative heme-binding domain-containing protein